MHCEKCHIPVKPYFTFCPNCGARLRGGAFRRNMGVLFIILSILAVSGFIFWSGFHPWPSLSGGPARLPDHFSSASPASRSPEFFPEPDDAGQSAPPIRLLTGRVIFYDIIGNRLLEVTAAASESGWVALPLGRCIGAERWVFQSVSGEDREIFGGVIGDRDDAGLWQFRTETLLPAPPIVPADKTLPMTWVALDAERRAELSGVEIVSEQENVDRILLTGFPEGAGVFLQDGSIVGWTFSGIQGGYLWKGLDEENRVYELSVADFYRLTFAGSREEQWIIAHGMDGENAADQLAAFARGFYRDPLLSAENTPARLTSAAAVAKMREIIFHLVGRNDAAAVLAVIDGRVLAGTGDAAFLKDMAVFADQAEGPERAIALIDAAMAEPVQFDRRHLSEIKALQGSLYVKWLNRLISGGDDARGAAVYERAASIVDAPEIHLLGVRLALGENDWKTAEAILRKHFFPMAFQDQVRVLEERIAALKNPAGPVLIRFSPGSGRIPVTGRVNDRMALEFIVDTGASMVTIPVAAAERLGIRMDGIPAENLMTAGGMVSARRVMLASIAIAGWTEYDIPAFVMDIPDQEGLGLLGLSYLNRFRMDLNAREGALVLVPR